MRCLRANSDVIAGNGTRRRLIGTMASATIVAMTSIAPLKAVAQGAVALRQIGLLANAREGDPRNVNMLTRFKERLTELGYIEGKSIRIQARFTDGVTERLPAQADELVKLNVDVIVAIGVGASVAARQVTSQTPIVMVVAGNAVGVGLIASLARPGGNVTGTTSMLDELGGKQLDLLHRIVPSARRIAVLVNSSNPGASGFQKGVAAAAGVLRIEPIVFDVTERRDFEPAFRQIEESAAEALVVFVDPMMNANRMVVIEFAARRRLPALCGVDGMVREGGLISYGPQFDAHYRRAADYVDRILRGAKPADLPVEQPAEFSMLVNLKTARVLGIALPPAVLAAADEVIE